VPTAKLHPEASARVTEAFKKGVSELAAQEPNLRHACRLAGEQQWWDPASGIAEGLGALYEADGRLGEWEEMVDDLQSVCAEGLGHQAKAGRERLWRTITEQGVKIGNPSQSVKQNLVAKRVFRHQRRYRVSQIGIDHLVQLLGPALVA